MKETIWFDMDGTLAALYDVNNWLDSLQLYDPTPYKEAAVMLNMSLLARRLNQLRKLGYSIGIISWLSKNSTPEYDEAVTEAKKEWLNRHLTSVSWDEINLVSYNTPKTNFMQTDNDILFDDEQKNRDAWTGKSYTPEMIFEILTELIKAAT